MCVGSRVNQHQTRAVQLIQCSYILHFTDCTRSARTINDSRRQIGSYTGGQSSTTWYVTTPQTSYRCKPVSQSVSERHRRASVCRPDLLECDV